MAIDIRETFQVQAPIEAVWQFVMAPEQVVTCMPGASLDQTIDERTFLGTVKVKVGAITAAYKGKVQFTQIDPAAHTLQMVADGREIGGGMAKGTMAAHLQALSATHTEVVVEASVDLTGRLMQVGRGMIQGVAHQLFQQFTASVTQRLEVSQARRENGTAAPPAVVTAASVHEPEAIRIVPLLLRALGSALRRLWQRLLGRSIPPS